MTGRARLRALLLAGCLTSTWACSGSSALNDATSDPTTVAGSIDPSTLTVPAGQLQLISMANRNVCLRPASGAQARAGDAVGTGLCSADAADSWRIQVNGTLSFGGALCLTATGTTAALAPCSSDTSQQLVLALGRLILGGSAGAGLAISVGDGSGVDIPFTPITLTAATDSTTSSAQQWQIGVAVLVNSGDANVAVQGFPVTLATVPGACLTGRGTTVGVTACNGSASQAWIINETGALQLGAYCLSASTPGSISQGTPSLFAICRSDDLGQRWQMAQGILSLQSWQLTPTTMPPPTAGYTPTALTTTAVTWQLGG